MHIHDHITKEPLFDREAPSTHYNEKTITIFYLVTGGYDSYETYDRISQTFLPPFSRAKIDSSCDNMITKQSLFHEKNTVPVHLPAVNEKADSSLFCIFAVSKKS